MTRYDSLFRFLFAVKRIQFSLQQVGLLFIYCVYGHAPFAAFHAFSPPHCVSIQGWMQLKNTRKLQWRQMAVHRILFSVRARMQFFIDNLQYYLQVLSSA
jgi:hypothetical protein